MKSLIQRLFPKSRTIQEPKKTNTDISLIDFLGSYDVNAREVYLLLLREYNPQASVIHIPQQLVNDFIPNRFYRGMNQLIHLKLVRRYAQTFYLLNPALHVNPDSDIQKEIVSKWTQNSIKELFNE